MILKQIINLMVLILIFSLAFMQPTALSLQNFKIPFTDLIFFITFFLWGITILLKHNTFRIGKFYIPLIIFLTAMVLSTIFSENLSKSLIKLSGVTYLVGLAVLIYNLIKTFEDARKVVFVWLAATFVSCLISVISCFYFYFDRSNPLLLYTLYHYGTLPVGNYPRVGSTFYNANLFCDYLNISIMLALGAFHLNWINKKTFAIFLCFFSIAAFFSLSPGLGGILLSVGLWLYLVFKGKHQQTAARRCLFGAIFSALSFFVITLIMPSDIFQAIKSFNFNESAFSESERVLIWQTAFENIWDNPIFGKGLGTDAVNITNPFEGVGYHYISDAHQIWLNVTVQCGLTGFAALFFLSVFLLRKLKPFVIDSKPDSVMRIVCGLGFVGAFLYHGLSGSFEDARHLWVVFGLIGSFSESDDKTAAYSE